MPKIVMIASHRELKVGGRYEQPEGRCRALIEAGFARWLEAPGEIPEKQAAEVPEVIAKETAVKAGPSETRHMSAREIRTLIPEAGKDVLQSLLESEQGRDRPRSGVIKDLQKALN